MDVGFGDVSRLMDTQIFSNLRRGVAQTVCDGMMASGSCGMGGFLSGWCHPGGVGDRGRSVFRGTRRTGMSALLLGV